MTRRDKLAEAVRYLACSQVAAQEGVAAARVLLDQYAPDRRGVTPLRRAAELLAPFAADPEVRAALAVLDELLGGARPQGKEPLRDREESVKWARHNQAQAAAALEANYCDDPWELARLTVSFLDRVSDALQRGSTASTCSPPVLSCKRGCAACCHSHVGCTVPEAAAVALCMKEVLTAGEQAALTARIAARAEPLRGLPTNRRINERRPCGLLEAGGTCLVYRIRPARCRGRNSIDDPARCGPPGGQIYRYWAEQALLFVAASEGIGEVLERHGRDGRQFELTLALHILLADPTALSRWAAGDRSVFEPALLHGGPLLRAGSRHLPLLPAAAVHPHIGREV